MMYAPARTPFSPDNDQEPNMVKTILERFESSFGSNSQKGTITTSWSVGSVHALGSPLDLYWTVSFDPFTTLTFQLPFIEARMCSMAPVETLTQLAWPTLNEETLQDATFSDINVFFGYCGFLSSTKLPNLSSYIQTIDAYWRSPVNDDGVEEETISEAASLTEELKTFLVGIGDTQLGKIVGVGRTTLISWRKNRHEARPSKIAGVFTFHALVAGLRRALGDTDARAWLFADRRLQKLASTASREEVVRAANRIIYAKAPRVWEPPYLSDPDATPEQ